MTALEIFCDLPKNLADKISSIKPSASPKEDTLFDNTNYEGTENKNMEGDSSTNIIKIIESRVIVLMYRGLQIAIDKAINGDLYIKSTTFNYLTKGRPNGNFRSEEEAFIRNHGGFIPIMCANGNGEKKRKALHISKVEMLLREYKKQLQEDKLGNIRDSRLKAVETVEAGIKFWNETVLTAIEQYRSGQKVQSVSVELPDQNPTRIGFSATLEPSEHGDEKIVLTADGAEVAEIMDGVKELSETFGEATLEKCSKYAVNNYRKINGIAADRKILVLVEIPIEEYLCEVGKKGLV